MSRATLITATDANGNPIAFFNVRTGNALDLLHFIRELIDDTSLEAMANMEGRTFEHDLAKSIGAIAINPRGQG